MCLYQSNYRYVFISVQEEQFPQKWSRRVQKLTDYIPLLFSCQTHSISYANLYQFWEKQMWKISILFICFLPSSSLCINWKLCDVCDCSANADHSYLIGAACELNWRVMTSKLSQKYCTSSFEHFFGFSRNYFLGVANMVRPHLDYWMRSVMCKPSIHASNR